MQRVALAGEHHPGERARQHQMAGLERDAVLAELVGKPGHAQGRMTEHAGRHAGLLDFRILVHDAADPAQIDVERPDRPAADHDAGRRASTISIAGTTYSVARSTSGRPTPGPFSGFPSTKASSISTRGRQ